MNGSKATNLSLLNDICSGMPQSACDVVVCAPFPYLQQCQSILSNSPLSWGGQDLSVHDSGAYTGEVSGAMLKDWGCQYVIVGHSERRTHHGESNELVAQKTSSAFRAGLRPVVCVGETLDERENGDMEQILHAQMDAVLAHIESANLPSMIVAYEPVWAIGTGKNATPEMAQEAHAILRARIAGKHAALAAQVRIVYGGSMKPDNAGDLLAMPDIDGGLIGGASLKAQDFLTIIRAA